MSYAQYPTPFSSVSQCVSPGRCFALLALSSLSNEYKSKVRHKQPKSDVRFQIWRISLVSDLLRVLRLSQGTIVITIVGSHCIHLYSKRSNQYQSKTRMQGVQLVGEFTTIYEIQGSISSSAEENQTTNAPDGRRHILAIGFRAPALALANWYK